MGKYIRNGAFHGKLRSLGRRTPHGAANNMTREMFAGLEWTATALAVGTLAWGAVAPGSQLFGPTIRRVQTRRGIALTFDDGPNPAITPHLLKLLDRYNARATFFLIGAHVRACPELAAEIANRGHSIGNHTDSHPNLIWKTPAFIRRELLACSEAITSATDHVPIWMRPPFGFRGPQLAAIVRETGHQPMVMWSRLAWDWKAQNKAPVIERLRRVTNGDIVLLHDGDHLELRGRRMHTVEALQYWLPRWKDAGHSFVTMDSVAPCSAKT
jgi:peptidoglycan/xylan/chitin deacetylase (PgdA/CDA1 family)